jgi:hypothetical protein
MTPKEKAEVLVNKYFLILGGTIHENPIVWKGTEKYNESIRCCLMLVNQIQEVLMTDELYNPGKLSFDRIDDYWEEVKQELNNIK